MDQFQWDSGRSVEQSLFEEPWAFEFFQAVRLLEMMKGNEETAGADSGGEPTEPVRFSSSLQLAFMPSEIRKLTPGDPPEMQVSFLSLGGVHGPLPTSLSEEIVRQSRKDPTTNAFLDIFHHRLISLLYRIHKAHHLSLTPGWPEQSAAAQFLFSIMGLGLPALRERMEIPDRAFLRYAGLFGAQPRSSAGLAAILSDFFSMPVTVHQFVGAWRPIPTHQCTRIGLSGMNQSLGHDTVCGSRFWNQQAGIELRAGPVSPALFQEFLPGGKAFRQASELIRLYLGPRMGVRMRLVMEPKGVRAAVLGQSRLGWTSWLRAEPQPARLGGKLRLGKDLRLRRGIAAQTTARIGLARLGRNSWLRRTGRPDDQVTLDFGTEAAAAK